MYWLNHVICWNSTTVHQYSEKGTCSIHTNQVNYHMMNFINFWLQMQVAIKHEKNLSFYPVVLNCKYHWCNFQIFGYSNLQNSLAASGGVITLCTARVMVSPYVCREEHGLNCPTPIQPCLTLPQRYVLNGFGPGLSLILMDGEAGVQTYIYLELYLVVLLLRIPYIITTNLSLFLF